MFVTPPIMDHALYADAPFARILEEMGQPLDKYSVLAPGLIACRSWSFNTTIAAQVEQYPDLPGELSPYGVCDSPDQFMATGYRALADVPERRFFVTFVRVSRSEQPPDGGWRWHKWGEYIGLGQPTCEHLFDEPLIEEVYTFHVYEIL